MNQKTESPSPEPASQVDQQESAKQRTRSRLPILLATLCGMLLTGTIAYFGFGVQLLTGLLGALTALGGFCAFLLAMLVRSRARVSLRALLILVAVIGGVLAWLGPGIVNSRKETNAARYLAERGATASFHSGPNPDDLDLESGWRIPGWVRDILGTSYFVELSSISFRDSEMTDEDLRILADVRSVEALDLRCEFVTADGLANMPLSKGTRSVRLRWTQLSKKSAAHLARLDELEQLHIDIPRFGNATSDPSVLEPFKGVNKMILYLDNAERAGIRAIASLPALSELTIQGGPMMDANGLAELAKSRSLVKLTIHGDPMMDGSGLVELAKSQSLVDLTIYIRNFGDSELAALAECRSLERLDIRNTSVTPDGAAAFHAARPDVRLLGVPEK